MPSLIRGISLQLLNDRKTTPFKQVQVTGMSFSVDLRSLDLYVYRYDPAQGMVPVVVGVELRLLTSGQYEQLSTNASGRMQSVFPDASIELRLDPATAPPGHSAALNYPIQMLKKSTTLHVVFIPDSPRRYYPYTTLL